MTRALSKLNQPSYETVKQTSDSYQLERASVRQILGISESTQFRYEKNNPVLKPNLADGENIGFVSPDATSKIL